MPELMHLRPSALQQERRCQRLIWLLTGAQRPIWRLLLRTLSAQSPAQRTHQRLIRPWLQSTIGPHQAMLQRMVLVRHTPQRALLMLHTMESNMPGVQPMAAHMMRGTQGVLEGLRSMQRIAQGRPAMLQRPMSMQQGLLAQCTQSGGLKRQDRLTIRHLLCTERLTDTHLRHQVALSS